MRVVINKRMMNRAEREAEKREPHINHLFKTSHFAYETSNVVGFLGEFSMCACLGIDWEENIRDSYKTADSGDIVYKDLVIDVKTETIPNMYIQLLLFGHLKDDDKYGRRLIPQDHIKRMEKYDAIVFGVMPRETLSDWYCLGYVMTEDLLKHSPKATTERPDGGSYPFPCLPIKTSYLTDIKELIE